jgi:tRNA pseudouridine13 synthase
MRSLHSVGIRCYFNEPVPAAAAKLKRIAADFVVQEITPSGRVCGISPILDYDAFVRAREMLETVALCNNDRETRTEIYSKLRHYPFVRAETRNGEICLEETDIDVYSFVLQKVMFNTVDACRWICRQLGLPPTSAQFAGNKDKRAVTFQEVSIRCSFMKLYRLAVRLKQQEDSFDWRKCIEESMDGDEIDKVDGRALDEMLKTCGGEAISLDLPEGGSFAALEDRIPSSIKIYDIKKSQPKKIGDLRGNRFTVVLDNFTRVELLKNLEGGFLNYFGHQRFGKNLQNHEIGREILEGNYEEAVNRIIGNSRGHELCREGRYTEALELCDSTEKYVLRSRIRKIGDRNIILGLQREVRMLYLHSYQSLKFNEALNERIEKGTDVMVGDLALSGGKVVRVEDPSLFGIFDVVLELERMDNKMLKGGYRKIASRAHNIHYEKRESQVIVSFSLDCSCYATVALREVVGDVVLD